MALREGMMAEDIKNTNNEKRYNLASLDENIEREPVYYYSREHRLSRASSAVRDLYDSKSGKISVAKRVFGNRGNIMTFVLIIISCLMISFVSKYSRAMSDVKIGGNTVTMAILKEEDTLILDITKQGPKKGVAYSGEVEITVSPVVSNLSEGETPTLFFHRVYFTQTGYERFQISLPFDIDKNEFILLLKTADELKSVKLRAKQ
jgi:hypothetical protein